MPTAGDPVPPRKQKTVTRQTLIGEGGVAFIATKVNEMGFIYHDRRVDHGIDGEIELVGPQGEALNRVIMVQSKASDNPFTYENADSFQWTADAADLDYWLGGNVPVVVVLSHPKQGQGWWIDITREFADPRRRVERIAFVDKRKQSFDKDAAAALMNLGVARGSGLYLPPPPRKETLTSNLLPIERMPARLYLAPTKAKSYKHAWNLLRDTTGTAAGWILHEDLVISFGDLRKQPLQSLCDDGVEIHETDEWATSTNRDTVNQFAELLRKTLTSDRAHEVQWHQARYHMHFRATRDLKPRLHRKTATGRGRTVFGPHFDKNDPEKVAYYHHAAVNPRFRRIGDRWYCQLEVDYCFTLDGKTEAPFADSLLSGIKRRERHPAVVGWMRMWESYLQGDLFTANNNLSFGSLLAFEVDRGIDERWWGPSPEPDDDTTPTSDAELDMTLSQIGVAEDDLLSILADDIPIPEPPPVRRSKHAHSRKSTANRRRVSPADER